MIPIETDKSKKIDYRYMNPHYTDTRFNKAQTVFVASGHKTSRDNLGYDRVEGASYDYSDRIFQWFSDEDRDRAWEAAKQKVAEKESPAMIEEYLRALYKDPGLELLHILTGVNVSNGYPYRVYGYSRSNET